MSNIKEYTLQEKKKKLQKRAANMMRVIFSGKELYFQVVYTDEESFLWKGGIRRL